MIQGIGEITFEELSPELQDLIKNSTGGGGASGLVIERVVTKSVTATEENQKVFTIPFDDFNPDKCYLDIKVHSVWINPDRYVIAGNQVTFNGTVDKGVKVYFTCYYLGTPNSEVEDITADKVIETSERVFLSPAEKARIADIPDKASSDEALAGLDDTKFMTAKKTKEAIREFGGGEGGVTNNVFAKAGQEYSYTFTTAGTNFTLPDGIYNRANQTIQIYHQGLRLTPDEEYSISEAGVVTFSFEVEKDGIIQYVVQDSSYSYNDLSHLPDLDLKADKSVVDALNAKVNTLNFSNPNLLINGDFSVWQEGVSFTDRWKLKYFADQWILWSDKETSVDLYPIGTADKTTRTSCRIVPNQASGETSTINIMQPYESKLINANNKLTLSFWVKCEGCGETTHIVSRIATGTSINDIDTTYKDVISTVNGNSWTYVKATFDISNFTENKNLMIIPFRKSGVEHGQVFFLMDVKLEIGEVATKFIPKSHTQELMDCQRYYEIIPIYLPEPLTAYSSHKGIVMRPRTFSYNVTKRVDPTLSIKYTRSTGTHDISYATEIGGSAVGKANIEVASTTERYNGFSLYIKDFEPALSAGQERVLYLNGAGKTQEAKGISGIIADARIY